MANKSKHASRSKRSSHKSMDFADFHRKAAYAKAKKEQRMSLAQIIKSAIHHTANKDDAELTIGG